jgi:hypothetical protein
MLVTFSGIVIEARDLQVLKADSPIVTRVEGNDTTDKAGSSLKALSGIVVTPSPMVADKRLSQPKKTLFPSDSTPSGITIEVNASQFRKAFSPMLFIVEGIVILLMPDE